MKSTSRRLVALLAVFAALPGCIFAVGGGTDDRADDALRDRIRGLEKRIDDLESRAGTRGDRP